MEHVMLVDQAKYKLIDISRCVKADWNYKDDNEELTTKLMENIKRNGQVENLLVRTLDTGFLEVVNGNHRYEALKRLGAKQVMVYDLGEITNAEAYRIAVETNETKFATDQVKLADLIKDMTQQFSTEDLVATMPYSSEQLGNFISMTDFDWDNYNQPTEHSATEDDPDKDSALHIKLTPRERDRWDAWVKRTKDITVGDWKEALLVLLTLADGLTDQDLESALAG